MLAFNLSVFFRNLRGEEVAFSARSAQTELHFIGGVVALQEHTDLTRHLAVTLGSGDLLLRIAFEEAEDDDQESANVEVRLLRESGEREILLLQTSFRFGDVSLKPASDVKDGPPKPPPPPTDEGNQPA